MRQSIYTSLIVEVTGCEREQALKIEEVMRWEHRTLDALSKSRFKLVAQRAQATAKQLSLI